MNDLQAVATGESTADLVVAGGRVYSSARGGFVDRDLAVVGDRIAALLEDGESVVGPETTIVDATDRAVLPGLIDAHTHLDGTVTFERWVPHLLPTGTTSVIAEVTGFGRRFASGGVRAFLDASADQPLSAFVCVPPLPLVDTFEPAAADEAEREALRGLLEHERVVGVGEVEWIHVVGRDSPIEELAAGARELGKPVVGHGAGCRGENLRAFATVVDNDHEAIAAEGVLERATNGLHVVGRCGSNRDDLDAVVDVIDELGRANVSLSTDGVGPRALLDGFGMAAVVRRVVEKGVDPATAVELATANPARHFGLRDRGAIAPGAVADLLVVESVESMAVETVVTGGEIVVDDGEFVGNGSGGGVESAADRVGRRESTTDAYARLESEPIAVDASPERFTASLEDAPDGVVRAMAVGRGFVTTETTAEPAVEDGRLLPAPEADALTATLIDDRAGVDRGFTGFLTGYGLEAGAIATTAAWGVPGLVTVAADHGDAAAAAERVASIGGGFAVVRDGEVLAEYPMPIAGVTADVPLSDAADALDDVTGTLRDLGADAVPTLLTVQTLTFPGVPALKLSFSGYADILDRAVVGLDPDE